MGELSVNIIGKQKYELFWMPADPAEVNISSSVKEKENNYGQLLKASSGRTNITNKINKRNNEGMQDFSQFQNGTLLF